MVNGSEGWGRVGRGWLLGTFVAEEPWAYRNSFASDGASGHGVILQKLKSLVSGLVLLLSSGTRRTEEERKACSECVWKACFKVEWKVC